MTSSCRRGFEKKRCHLLMNFGYPRRNTLERHARYALDGGLEMVVMHVKHEESGITVTVTLQGQTCYRNLERPK